MKQIFITLMLSSCSIFAQSQIIDNYIKYGLENNLALKQKQFSLKQSIADLAEAKGRFYPSVGINARYTRAGGGRVIDIPIGDLVNPIHFGLNTLNPSFNYPTNIPNGVTRFLRPEEHDTKVSLLQPILQPALFYNHSIKSRMVELSRVEKNLYSRDLIANIKDAYFNYLKSIKIIAIINDSYQLVSENLRVTESLFKNDKVTIDIVHRAKAELLEIEQKRIEGENNSEIAASYFNFLLNKPLDTEIVIDTSIGQKISIPSLTHLEETASNQRDEIKQLEIAIEIAKESKGLANSAYLPGLSLAVDYGFQGEEYKFGKSDDYWMASLVLNWNLFNGFQDEANAEKAEIETRSLETKIEELKDMISLETKEAYKNYIVALKSIKSADERLASYKKSFIIVKRKFGEGLVSQLEYLDAQNKYTQAEVTKTIAEYNLLQRYSTLEKVTAQINLNKYLTENKK